MWPKNYFSLVYWASRFWGPVVEDSAPTPGIPSEWITLESDFSPIVAMNNDRHVMATEVIDVNYLTGNDTHTIDTSNNQIILNIRTN